MASFAWSVCCSFRQNCGWLLVVSNCFAEFLSKLFYKIARRRLCFFFEAYTQQGRAYIRRHRPDWAARPALKKPSPANKRATTHQLGISGAWPGGTSGHPMAGHGALALGMGMGPRWARFISTAYNALQRILTHPSVLEAQIISKLNKQGSRAVYLRTAELLPRSSKALRPPFRSPPPPANAATSRP